MITASQVFVFLLFYCGSLVLPLLVEMAVVKPRCSCSEDKVRHDFTQIVSWTCLWPARDTHSGSSAGFKASIIFSAAHVSWFWQFRTYQQNNLVMNTRLLAVHNSRKITLTKMMYYQLKRSVSLFSSICWLCLQQNAGCGTVLPCGGDHCGP